MCKFHAKLRLEGSHAVDRRMRFRRLAGASTPNFLSKLRLALGLSQPSTLDMFARVIFRHDVSSLIAKRMCKWSARLSSASTPNFVSKLRASFVSLCKTTSEGQIFL